MFLDLRADFSETFTQSGSFPVQGSENFSPETVTRPGTASPARAVEAKDAFVSIERRTLAFVDGEGGAVAKLALGVRVHLVGDPAADGEAKLDDFLGDVEAE